MAFDIKWKIKQKYRTVGTIPESNIKIVERDKSLLLAHKYMTADFPGLVQDWVKLVVLAQTSPLSEMIHASMEVFSTCQ